MKASFVTGLLLAGAAIGGWALIAFTAGLKQADWQISELMRQYLIAVGVVKPSHTLVDFYTQIKGIEYLICVSFFIAFPLFYKYINQEVREVETSTRG